MGASLTSRNPDCGLCGGVAFSLKTSTLAQQWVIDNQPATRAIGYDESAVIVGRAAVCPPHPLWVHFERVHLRGLRRVLGDRRTPGRWILSLGAVRPLHEAVAAGWLATPGLLGQLRVPWCP
jgi:hypothetical protein